jgi:hypothetical protein
MVAIPQGPLSTLLGLEPLRVELQGPAILRDRQALGLWGAFRYLGLYLDRNPNPGVGERRQVGESISSVILPAFVSIFNLF